MYSKLICFLLGTYDINQDISTNTAIATPLLSRFDLVLILLDHCGREWDQKISTYLLASKLKPAQTTKGSKLSSNISSSNNVSGGGEGGYSECWSVEKLRAYIQHIQTAYQPTITHEASQLLVSVLNMLYLLFMQMYYIAIMILDL